MPKDGGLIEAGLPIGIKHSYERIPAHIFEDEDDDEDGFTADEAEDAFDDDFDDDDDDLGFGKLFGDDDESFDDED